eukprot:5726310-Ditylum_brightwellii.AAC.1
MRRRALGSNNNTAGSDHDNSMLESTGHEVEFPDRDVKEYATNIIAENMQTQVGFERFTMTMMEGIIDHAKDKATVVHMNNKYVITSSGKKKLGKSTAGWKLQILCKDKPESWVNLKDI